MFECRDRGIIKSRIALKISSVGKAKKIDHEDRFHHRKHSRLPGRAQPKHQPGQQPGSAPERAVEKVTHEPGLNPCYPAQVVNPKSAPSLSNDSGEFRRHWLRQKM